MRIVLTVFLALLSFSAWSQQDKVRSTIETYFGLIENQEISKALDHVYPELIDMLGKETFENMFSQIFNAPGMEISLDNFKVDSISSAFKSDERTFVLVKYKHEMTFKVDMSNDKEGLLAPFLLSAYKRKFGTDNVTFEEPGTFIIDVAKDMYAIQSTDYTGWKVIEYEESMGFFLEKIIPEEVRKHFNN